jgi:dihydrofolate synthase/folylpolyglutamate synthase
MREARAVRMRYEDAIGRLFALQSRGIRLGRSRMREALRWRGRPDRGLSFLHVTGTNGKGSTSAMLERVLREAGKRTGLFTSPHLHRWTERIRIDGAPIGEGEAARRIGEMLDAFAAPGAPETTFFELTTLCAIEAFRDHRCEVCVMEIGLGGRLDATNATASELSVVTGIALDHTSILGPTPRHIAREKAGIFRRGVPVVVGATDVAARRVLAQRARVVGAPAWLVGRDFRATEAPGNTPERPCIDVVAGTRALRGVRLGLAGEHQVANAACAVAGLWRLSDRGWRIPEVAIRRGLARARWPGRLERISGSPDVLFDAAHNPDGARALARYLATTAEARSTALVFGAMKDKDFRASLRALAPHVARVFYPPRRMARGASGRALERAWPGVRARSMRDALARARRVAGRDGLVVVTGSIFVVAEARALVLGARSDPFIRM